MVVTPFKKSVQIIKNNDKAIANWISRLISPHIVGGVLTSVMALRYGDRPLAIFLWLTWLIPLLIIPPLVYLLWLVHRGTIEDIYMPRRETRLRPLAVMMMWLMICLGAIRYWQAPAIVEIFVLTITVMVGVLSLVTLFWKISFHGAAISAAATTTVMVAGSSAWPVVLLVPLVGWARVRLRRHTTRQVIYGSLIGALMALLFVYRFLLEILPTLQ
ncbi:MAG: phosphatase PAP2 family protein [Chloroflexota bacterium]